MQSSNAGQHGFGDVALGSTGRDDTNALTISLREIASRLGDLVSVFENQASESPFLDIEAAARFTCLSVGSIEYYAKRMRQLPYHVVGKTLVFNRDDLVRFMGRFRRPGVDG